MKNNKKPTHVTRKRVTIVAEIGINHNGDMELARNSIIAAAEAGANSVKFQNYYTEDFISNKKLKHEYKSQGKNIIESQYDLFKRNEITRDQLFFLKDICDTYGMMFHSTPTNERGVKDLQDIGCTVIKNGSDYLTNLSLIRAMGETGLKTILSTGMATIAEIDMAVRAYKETGNEDLMLLHCTSCYPTPPNEVNLKRIQTLKDCFGLDVGFSDHTDGVTAAIGATFFGASWIEKHFTLDKNLPGPDHWFSMDPEELKLFAKSIRESEEMMGTSCIGPTPSEAKSRQQFRLSCVAARGMREGELITSSDIAFHRPGDGLSPAHAEFINGLKLAKPIQAGEQFNNKYFCE